MPDLDVMSINLNSRNLLSRRSAERRDLRGLRKALRKLFNPALHVRAPELQIMKRAYFLNGRLRCPAIEHDPIRGDEHAAAVSTQPAMDEDDCSVKFDFRAG